MNTIEPDDGYTPIDPDRIYREQERNLEVQIGHELNQWLDAEARRRGYGRHT